MQSELTKLYEEIENRETWELKNIAKSEFEFSDAETIIYDMLEEQTRLAFEATLLKLILGDSSMWRIRSAVYYAREVHLDLVAAAKDELERRENAPPVDWYAEYGMKRSDF